MVPATPADTGLPAPAASAASPSTGVRRGRQAALLLALALIALGLAWELVVAPTGRGFWAVKVLPLVLALPGLTRHRLYTYRWLSLALWLYVLEGLVRSTSGEAAPVPLLAALQTLLAVLLFAVVGLYVRQRLRRPTQ